MEEEQEKTTSLNTSVLKRDSPLFHTSPTKLPCLACLTFKRYQKNWGKGKSHRHVVTPAPWPSTGRRELFWSKPRRVEGRFKELYKVASRFIFICFPVITLTTKNVFFLSLRIAKGGMGWREHFCLCASFLVPGRCRFSGRLATGHAHYIKSTDKTDGKM